ncbi:HD domain-containing phosphohydrolase [Lacimicrobium alkaliphilum]|uniref:Metal-dependent phosphohydrolase n=1 Tax=Lacimicrobium alkaliphilum TaxID=1526571 RepID=A0A0U2JI75_9ALTE|nr:HD domain-containing phosphohydrolase [Lacimicrobium alkaliphilum]ALS97078.1 metal-dependent phosphohydrolase [Lacimicrobium alkaliphilum]
MQSFRPEDLDDDILTDLLEEINELYEASEQTLMELELQPEDNELQRALFRSIHTIKGDLGLVNFTPMIPLLQHVEDLLDYLRKGQIKYTSTMSDLVLLTMDRVKLFVEACSQAGQAKYDAELYKLLAKQLSRIKPENGPEHEKLLTESVLLLDPSLDAAPKSEAAEESAQQSAEQALSHIGLTADTEDAEHKDILFFRELMEPVERRSKYWQGRGDRIARLALFLNKMRGSPVEPNQLAVACYVHDFGMAFMPLRVLHKVEPLEQNEFNLMRSHVYKSARLLEHLDQWNEARRIVIQHHERMDGSGYPLGIKGEDICEGAKLLAIIDTFDALTHSRAHQGHHKRPKKRAVMEINKVADSQFCPHWIKVFNKAMANLLLRQGE